MDSNRSLSDAFICSDNKCWNVNFVWKEYQTLKVKPMALKLAILDAFTVTNLYKPNEDLSPSFSSPTALDKQPKPAFVMAIGGQIPGVVSNQWPKDWPTFISCKISDLTSRAVKVNFANGLHSCRHSLVMQRFQLPLDCFDFVSVSNLEHGSGVSTGHFHGFTTTYPIWYDCSNHHKQCSPARLQP